MKNSWENTLVKKNFVKSNWRKSYKRSFRFEENVYLSAKELIFPIMIKMDNRDYVKWDVVANLVDKEEELLLSGLKTLQE